MIYKSKEIRWAKIRLLFSSSGWKRAEYLKKNKVFFEMGDNCYYHTRDLPAEPFLVKLHNDVRIAAGVRLITHDIASYMINGMGKYEKIGKAHYESFETLRLIVRASWWRWASLRIQPGRMR